MSHLKPCVLCLSGLDPSGGAGIQADIESINSMGGHPLPVITAVTVQDTHNVSGFMNIEHSYITDQANKIFSDIPVKSIKIGMIGSAEMASAIAKILGDHPTIPVIYDPVFVAGGGGTLGDARLIEAIRNEILPHVNILTPNSIEARELSMTDDLTESGITLMKNGVGSVLITGTHEEQQHVDNLWFNQQKLEETFSWNRLPFEYHGSGCTLASAIAGLVAHRLEYFTAISEAQEYTWNALEQAYQVNETGQYIPNRFFWSQQD